jgi:hypothetical protein
MKFESEVYNLEYDAEKNRIYVTLFGFWESPEQLASAEAAWGKMLAATEPGFTVLVDVRKMVTPTPEVLEHFKKTQERVKRAGISRRAEVMSESVIAKMATQKVSERSGIDVLSKQFTDPAEAEAWLDEA